MVIGLTGKYCAGKNAAESVLTALGYPSIDVDKLGHHALESEIDHIEEAFGAGVIVEKDGIRKVDRRALGSIVFSEPEALKRLEAISHPWMKNETARLVEEYKSGGASHVIVNAAILYKMKLDSLCDCVIWIEAPLLQRVRRAMKRDNAGFIQVFKRIYAQRQLKPKPSLNSVDIYRVGNNSGTEALARRLDDVLMNIEQKGRDGR